MVQWTTNYMYVNHLLQTDNFILVLCLGNIEHELSLLCRYLTIVTTISDYSNFTTRIINKNEI
jgi:hypothetical protein